MIYTAIVLLLCSFLTAPNYAQTSLPAADERWREAGVPYIQTYSASVHGCSHQNWDIDQDQRGVMYFANTSCLLEYDGVSWRQTYRKDGKPIWSVSTDSIGRIWVGASQEFGYLAPDSAGTLQYNSLWMHVPEQIRKAESRWRVAATSQSVYFRSRKTLFRWNDELRKLKTWQFEKGLGECFVAEDALFIRQPEVGLLRMENDSLRLVPDGERLANTTAYVALPFSVSTEGVSRESAASAPKDNFTTAGKLFLLATYTQGLFVYDGVTFSPYKNEADAYLKQNKILCGAVLADGSYALGTRYGGVVVIDQQGNLKHILNKATGLPDNMVYDVYTDSRGGLWLAMDKGLSRVELPSPLTRYSLAPALQSGVTGITRYQGKLFASTSEGLIFLERGSSPGERPAFEVIPGLKVRGNALLSTGSHLLLTSHEGIFQILNKQASLLNKRGRASPIWLHRSRYDTNRVYVGLLGGLGLLQRQGGTWRFAGEVAGINESVEGIEEDGSDVLWLTTRYGTAVRLNAPSLALSTLLDSSTIKIERFGEANGLPRGWVGILTTNDRLLFPTNKGLRYFEPKSQKFQLSSSFGGLFADTTCNIDGKNFHLAGTQRVLTMHSGNIGLAAPEPNGSYSWNTLPFLRIEDSGSIWTYYVDEKYEGVFWFGGADGIIRYDETIAKDYTAGYSALIRRVTLNSDSVIYGGAYANLEHRIKAPTLAYENNTLTIEYAAPYYDNEAANQYQYFLESFEEDWSNWTGDTKVTYRKLPEGDYRFRVRARNVYRKVGEESSFAVKILPPWYRTWWSYSFYGLMLFSILYAARRYEMNRQQHRHQAKLKDVETKKLKELDEMKSDFFANISHEFRTPLTLILGPAEQLMEEVTKNGQQKLSLIRRSAQRLLQLIDQLLDLSKLERGKLQLQTTKGDFISFLKGLVMSFESLAEQNGVNLQLEIEDARQYAADKKDSFDKETYFDHDKIEKIFSNLLSNAFKFTPKGGTVKVTGALLPDCGLQADVSNGNQSHEILHPRCKICIHNAEANATTYPVNCVEITIADTGEGIPAGQLPHIFDRFYQVDASSRRAHGGTGIGLALVKELVEIHYGSIVVTSEENSGTTFTVCLPLGKAHLAPEQTLDIPLNPPSKGEKVTTPPFEGGPGGMFESDTEPSAPETVSPFEEPVLSLLKEGLRGMSESRAILNATDFSQPTTDRPIILIIEDNADVRAYIREQLETEYTILEAEDGEAGIAQAFEAIPDLVISDVMMPKKDGFEVCETLKTDERTSHIPIILLTAKAQQEAKFTGLETGADAYILKPFRQQELAVRVRNLIALRRKLRERFSTATIIKPSEVEATSMDREFLQRVIEIIETRFEDEAFNVEALANAVAMSVTHLNRKLNALIGQPAGQMLRSMRLQRAADLLAKKSGTVAEICYALGFSDQANFTRSFKKQFGCSPSEYQKTHPE